MNTEEKLAELESQIFYQKGYFKGILSVSSVAAILLLSWLGYESWVGIPKEIRAQYDEQIQETINELVDKRAHELVPSVVEKAVMVEVSKQVPDAVGEFSATTVPIEVRKLVALHMSQELEQRILPRIDTLLLAQTQTVDFETERLRNELSELASSIAMDLETVSIRAEKLNARLQAEVAASNSVDNSSYTIFSNSWVKEGYFLPIEENLRLYPDEIGEDDVKFRIVSLGAEPKTWSFHVDVSSGFSFEYNNIKYDGQLEKTGNAGFNPFTLASYFRLKRTTQ